MWFRLNLCLNAVLCFLAVVPGIVGPAAAGSLSDMMASARTSGQAVFGSTEFASGRLSALPQWGRVLDVMAADGPQFRRCAADPAACATPQLKSWRQIITAAQGRSRMDQLKMVNQFFNRWPYKVDSAAFGRREYWATPEEFMARSGDCEDYAIAKFFALRQLGFGNEELRIVVLWDEIRGLGHAVLTYHGSGDIVVLDNMSNFIVSHTRYRHYIPQISVNETKRWAHVVNGKQIPSAVATRN